MIFFGIWIGFTANWLWFSGLWLALIGWFLLNAAQESVVQGSMRSVLTGSKAEDVMATECSTVLGDRSLADLVGGKFFAPVTDASWCRVTGRLKDW